MPPRRSGLGRGLDSLLPSAESRSVQIAVDEGSLRELPVDAIVPNPHQPRQVFDDTGLNELTASVSELGILQPLLVRETAAGTFELVAGERRLRAARAAGLERVPALLVETDDRGSLERALVENIHREDLDALEEAAAYRALLDEGGLTQDALAKRLSRSPQTISNSLRLLELPTSIQRMIHDRSLSGGHGKALLGLQDSPFQDRVAQRVVSEQLSVRATETLVRNYKEKFETPRSRSAMPLRSAVVADSERRLKDRLQTKVKVEVSKRRRRIIIDAASDEDLARITSVIVGEGDGGAATTVSPSD